MVKHILKNIIKISITAIILTILVYIIRDHIGNIGEITKISNSVGIFGPIVFILLMSIGILLTPIPSAVFIITAGYLYGTWIGALYGYIGHLIAAICVFAIFEKFKINYRKGKYKKYRKLIQRNKKILYLLYMFPIIPISVITIISASLKIKWKQFLTMIFISFIPNVLFFSFFGERISNRNPLEVLIFLLGLLIIVLIVFKVMKRENVKK